MLYKTALSLALLLAVNAHGHGHEDIDPDTPDNYIAQHVSTLTSADGHIYLYTDLDGIGAPREFFLLKLVNLTSYLRSTDLIWVRNTYVDQSSTDQTHSLILQIARFR